MTLVRVAPLQVLGLVLLLSALSKGLVAAQDTVVVRADNSPVWGHAPRLIEEIRIGAIDGAEESASGRVVGVVVLGDGEIWVADRTANTIRRFDSLGHSIGRVGGPGAGPGEFRYLLDLTAMADGRVAAWDMVERRISVFSRGGDFQTSIRVPEARSADVKPALRVDQSNRFYVRLTDWHSRAWIRTGENGQVQDSIPIPPAGMKGTPSGAQFYLLGPMRTTYAHSTMSLLNRDGFLMVARNDEYAFHRPLPDGKVLRIERPWEPVRVKHKERAAHQLIENHYSQRAKVRAERVSTEKPPWWAFWGDEEERLWVARHGEGYHRPESPSERRDRERLGNPPNEWWEPLAFDVIGPSGTFLGTLHFSNPQTDLAAARGNRVWVIEAGEYDERYIVRYRVEPGS